MAKGSIAVTACSLLFTIVTGGVKARARLYFILFMKRKHLLNVRVFRLSQSYRLFNLGEKREMSIFLNQNDSLTDKV